MGIGYGVLSGLEVREGVAIPETVIRAVVGLGLLIGGAVLLARPIALMVVTPFVRLLFPEDHDYTPPPLFSLARHYWKKGQTEAAIAQYRKIVKYHPQEVEGYRELAQLLVETGKRNEADAVVRQGVSKLRAVEAREGLSAWYGELLSGAVGREDCEEDAR